MNNKDFINELARRIGKNTSEIDKMVEEFLELSISHFVENDVISITGFGVFEVKKRLERISVNPATGKRFLVPPKLSLSFRQSNLLKDKLNETGSYKPQTN